MEGLTVETDLLQRFEEGLNPARLGESIIPASVLGYGEISTVIEIPALAGLACKRMPMFRDEAEAQRYEALYQEYIDVLENSVGLHLPPSRIVRLVRKNRVVLYILQEKLPAVTIGNQAIHYLSPADVNKLVWAVLAEARKVFDFNRRNRGQLEIGLDNQISNWSIVGFDPARPTLEETPQLLYFDTSAPLLRKEGVEQQNPELFLRSAPSFLRWIIRWLFLDDVMTRYYDFRKVTIDLIANFYKEQRPELVPGLVESANRFFSAAGEPNVELIREAEVESYYREDATTWRVYLAFRRLDRGLSRFLGKEYPYILPGPIKR